MQFGQITWEYIVSITEWYHTGSVYPWAPRTASVSLWKSSTLCKMLWKLFGLVGVWRQTSRHAVIRYRSFRTFLIQLQPVWRELVKISSEMWTTSSVCVHAVHSQCCMFPGAVCPGLRHHKLARSEEQCGDMWHVHTSQHAALRRLQ